MASKPARSLSESVLASSFTATYFGITLSHLLPPAHVSKLAKASSRPPLLDL